jgi:hypothetical protein
MDPTLWIAIGVVYVLSLVDVWTSRLTVGAKVMWSFTIVFLVGVGLFAWLLTRHSAHQPLELPREEA